MSATAAAGWRQFFGYNRYASICARAVRNSLKEEHRVKAERRGEMSLRYQQWKDGKAGEQTLVDKASAEAK